MKERFHSLIASELEAFLRHKRALGFTYERPEGTLRNFDRYLRPVGPAKIKRRGWAQLIENWLSERPQRKPKSVGSDLQIVRQFCLFRRRYDPTAFVPELDWGPVPAKRSARFVPHVFSRSEIVRMLKETDRFTRSDQYNRCVRMLLLVLYCTGLRFGEAARLRISDLDLKQKWLRVNQSKGRSRLVPFRTELANEFKRYLRRRPAELLRPETPVFLNRYGQAHSTKTISNGLRKLMRKAGVKKEGERGGPRPYDLRHTFAVHRLTRWYRQRVDLDQRLPWLSTYMGHLNILGTEIYLTTTVELLNLVAHRFEKRFRQKRWLK